MFRREHVLRKTFHQIRLTRRFGIILVRILGDFAQPKVVQRVGLPIDGEQVHRLLARFGHCAQSGEQNITVGIAYRA